MSETFAFKDGDWVLEPNGQPRIIDGSSKASQDVALVLSTPFDASRNFGNEAYNANNTHVIDNAAVEGFFTRNVTAAIARLRAKQALTPIRFMQDSEKITGIQQMRVKFNAKTGSVSYLVVVNVKDVKAPSIRQAHRVTFRHLYPNNAG